MARHRYRTNLKWSELKKKEQTAISGVQLSVVNRNILHLVTIGKVISDQLISFLYVSQTRPQLRGRFCSCGP